ncbi:MAG: hypothetical protein NZM04_06905 [Methylacidiphilales bacterium]|nr:hypothetical protein [Candidatus Methylacidiphilales bacterium]MDW8349303.1 hypothetical protein [Verrucomicrobiae bacterium]
MKIITLSACAIALILHLCSNKAEAEFRVLAVKTAANVVGGEGIVAGQILPSGTTVRTGPTGQLIAQYKNTFNIFQITSNTTVRFGVGNIRQISEITRRMMYMPVSWTWNPRTNRPAYLPVQDRGSQATVRGILFEIMSGGVMFNVDMEGEDVDVKSFQANTSLGQGVFDPSRPSKIMIFHQKGEGNPAPQVPGARMGEFTAYIVPKDDDARLDVVGRNTVINTKIDEEAEDKKDNRVDELFAAFKEGSGETKPAGNLLYLEYMADYILPDFKDFDGKVATVMNGGSIANPGTISTGLVPPQDQPPVIPTDPVQGPNPASQ